MTVSPPLRGRASEKAVIDAALANALRGQGGVVLVEGRAGFGKTRLLEEALRAATRAGVRAGFGRADADDAAVPLAPLMSACFGGSSPLLSGDDRAVLRIIGKDRSWVLLELEELLERSAQEHPMLLCLDDVQWADAGTIDALRSLPVRLAGIPIVWVVAYRGGHASPALLRAVATLEEIHGPRLVLGSLDDEAVDQVITDLTRARADLALLRIAGSAHGIPFVIPTRRLGVGRGGARWEQVDAMANRR
jgi:predicted ATPase